MTTPDKQTFRDAMACVGAAVNIITTDGPAGLAGFTASAVCSVTDSPPTLLVCLNRGASVWPTFSGCGGAYHPGFRHRGVFNRRGSGDAGD